MIISSREIQSDQVESIFLGQERLFVNLDQFMYLANQRSVTFKELRGISFVVLSDIGPWRKIVSDHIPDAKFLYQTDYDALRELTKYTNVPFFTTKPTGSGIGLSISSQIMKQNGGSIELITSDTTATLFRMKF